MQISITCYLNFVKILQVIHKSYLYRNRVHNYSYNYPPTPNFTLTDSEPSNAIWHMYGMFRVVGGFVPHPQKGSYGYKREEL